MADYVTLTTGENVAADDIGGVVYQRVKLIHGANDTNAGDVAIANGLPVQPATGAAFPVTDNGGSITVDGTVAVTGALTDTELRASAVPVSIASIPTHAVTDGGGSLTVDGTVAVTGTFWQATQPVSVASIPSHDVTNAGTFAVQASQNGTWNITNISGTVSLPTGAATAAKQPALGVAGTASADVITIQGVTGMTAVKVDGSAVTQPVSDGGGSLTVDGSVSVSGLVPGTSATSLAKAEDAAAADGDTGVAVWAVRKDTAATTVGADGDYHPFEVDANGRLWVNGSSVTQPVSGTFWQATQPVSIAAAVAVTDNNGSLTVDAPVGTPLFVRLSDGAAAISTLPVSLASVPSHPVTNAGTFAVQAAQNGTWTVGLSASQTLGTVTTVSTLTGGGVAHDGVDSGNPIKIGAKAETSPKGSTPVADGDRTDLYADSDGMLMVKLCTSGADFISETVSNTDGNSTAFTNFSAVASTKNAVTAYSIFRTDSGTTMAYVDFRDGTAGSVLWRVPLPPNGGANLSLGGVPIFKTSANTALAYDVSSALTTVFISVSGFQTKV